MLWQKVSLLRCGRGLRMVCNRRVQRGIDEQGYRACFGRSQEIELNEESISGIKSLFKEV